MGIIFICAMMFCASRSQHPWKTLAVGIVAFFIAVAAVVALGMNSLARDTGYFVGTVACIGHMRANRKPTPWKMLTGPK